MLERVVYDLEPMTLFVAGQRPAGPWRVGLAAGDVAAAQKAVKVWEQGNAARLRHEIVAAVVADGKANGERLKAALADAAAGLRHELKEPWFLMPEDALGPWLEGVAAAARVRVQGVDAWCARVEAIIDNEMGE